MEATIVDIVRARRDAHEKSRKRELGELTEISRMTPCAEKVWATKAKISFCFGTAVPDISIRVPSGCSQQMVSVNGGDHSSRTPKRFA
jgi:hypothetical protein